MGVIIFIGILAVVGFISLNAFNTLVREKNLVKNSFSQIDVQLKRRYDLIPNLVETAKAYMKHEKETLDSVIQARNQAFQSSQSLHHNPLDNRQMKGLVAAETQLGQAMSRMMVVMENYPDLKANTSMNSLMEEISSTENKISFSRQAYNDSVMGYNISREVFPNNLLAGFFNFKAATVFEITQSVEKEPVKVTF